MSTQTNMCVAGMDLACEMHFYCGGGGLFFWGGGHFFFWGGGGDFYLGGEGHLIVGSHFI